MPNKYIVFIRIAFGLIFLSEGIQKFLFPEIRGVGRFIELGFAYPEFTSYMVGSFEVICGILVLIGLATRFASVPLLVIMIVAITTTKISHILEDGFWVIAHAARTNFAMLFSNLFLIFSGSRTFSIDGLIGRERNSSTN